MHRTYSMRASRAPTASQIQVLGIPCARLMGWATLTIPRSQNPPPPPSSTKSGRFFGRGGLGMLRPPLPPQTIRHDPNVFGGLRFIDMDINRKIRTCPPPQCCRRLRPRSRQEAGATCQDGEERHAKSRDGGQGADGGCRMRFPPHMAVTGSWLIHSAATTVALGRGLRRRRLGRDGQAGRAAVRDRRARGPIRRPLRPVPRHREEH